MSDDEIKGRAIGAKARADALSPARRSEIAKVAAAKRWPKTLQATHKGSFKDDFGIDVECFVLDDETHTAVISQTGMGVSLGLVARGNAFPRFLATQGMAGALGAELEEKINNPLKFQWVSPGAQQTGGVATVYGYDVTMLIDVCKAIIKADGEGKLRNEKVAKQAAIIIGASAKSGIQGLVYKLAGYDATKEEVVAAFKLYVREEAREYEKEFPDQLYREWYRLYQLPEKEKTTKPWKFRHLTVDQVYRPLARSNGKFLS